MCSSDLTALSDKRGMERRREPRFPATGGLRLWILGDTETDRAAQLEELSGIGARLRTQVQIPIGTAVRVEWEESMYLGECVHSTLADEGGYIAGIHFEQVLENVGDIRRMMESLMAAGEDQADERDVKSGLSRRSRSRG